MGVASEVVCVVECPRSDERINAPLASHLGEKNAGTRNGTVHGNNALSHGWVSLNSVKSVQDLASPLALAIVSALGMFSACGKKNGNRPYG